MQGIYSMERKGGGREQNLSDLLVWCEVQTYTTILASVPVAFAKTCH